MNIQIYGTLGGEADPAQLKAAYDACEDKGATIPEEQTLANLADCIETIPGQIVIPPEAGALVNLVVGTLPKVAYVEDDPLDLSGMVILGNYSNGGQYDVTPNCTITANDPVLYTDTQIVVSLDEVTLNIPITVTGEPVKAPDSVIALYHLDNNLKDEVTSETATGAPGSYVSGKFSTGAQGVNNNNYKLLPVNISANDLQTNDYTIEMWIKCTATNFNSVSRYKNDTDTALLFASDNVTSAGLRLRTESSSWDQGLASSCSVDTTFPNYNANVFHHLALVIKHGTYVAYLDGKKACHGNVNSYANSAFYRLYPSGSNAHFDEIMICAEARYLTDFEPPHGPYYIEE